MKDGSIGRPRGVKFGMEMREHTSAPSTVWNLWEGVEGEGGMAKLLVRSIYLPTDADFHPPVRLALES